MRQPFRRTFRQAPESPAHLGPYFQFTKLSLFAAGLSIAVLAMAAPALAGHIGPHRTVPDFVWERLACHYEAIYDPPGPGFFGCTLDLYEPPDGLCTSTGSVADLFNPAVCSGWPGSCTSLPCDIQLTDSVQSCSSGDPGCQLVEETVTYPPATIAADLQNCALSDGWCITPPNLRLVGTEPLAGETILLIEGTRNGVAFACSGAVCDVSLVEGPNAFTFWARSSFGDTSELGTLTAQVNALGPSVSIPDSWYIWEPVAISVDDADIGVAEVTLTIDGGTYGLRKYAWGNLSLVPDDFIWDRHFGEIIAPIGEYTVTVTATDNLGKVGFAIGEIVIPDPNELAETTASLIGSSGSDQDATGIAAPPFSLADLLARLPDGDMATLGDGSALMEAEPVANSSDFAPTGPERDVASSASDDTTTAETLTGAGPSTDLSKGPGSGVLWGAAALAAASAATAYSLARRRAREEQYAEMRQAAAGSATTARASRSLSITSRLQMAVAAAAAAAAAAVKAAQERAELAIRQRNERLRLEREERLEQAEWRQALAASQAAASEPPLDMAKLKQQDYAAYEASQQAEAYQRYRASETASVSIAAPAPEPSWWQRLLDNATSLVSNAETQVRRLASSRLVRYGLPITLTTLATSTGLSWGRNIIENPGAFVAPRENLGALLDQVVADHPDLLVDPREKLGMLLDRPHNALQAGGDLVNTLAAGAAGYLDVAWQQNPIVQWATPQLRSLSSSCPSGFGEAWWRRCAAALYLGAGLIENPADTALGVANSLLIHPIEGAIEYMAFSLENNPVRMWGQIIQAARADGLDGAIDTVGSFLHRFSAMTADTQVQSALWTTAFLLLMTVPPLAGAAAAGKWGLWAGALQQSVRLGLPSMVLAQSAEAVGQIDQAIQAAPDRETAMEIPGSHRVRTFVVNTALILSLLLGPPALRKWSEWQRARSLLTPAVQAALETVPLAERAQFIQAATRLGLTEAEVIAYADATIGFSPQTSTILGRLPIQSRLQSFQRASASAIESETPLDFSQLGGPASEALTARLEALVAADVLSHGGLSQAEVQLLSRRIAQISTRTSPGTQADRVVIGRFFEPGEGFGYTQEANTQGGIYFDTPVGVYNALGRNRALMELIDLEFLRLQMEARVPRIELFGETIGQVHQSRAGSFTDVEIGFLEKVASEYGYVLDRNSNTWVLKGN